MYYKSAKKFVCIYVFVALLKIQTTLINITFSLDFSSRSIFQSAISSELGMPDLPLWACLMSPSGQTNMETCSLARFLGRVAFLIISKIQIQLTSTMGCVRTNLPSSSTGVLWIHISGSTLLFLA